MVEGRIGNLLLKGPEGNLCISIVYLDPASKLEQQRQMETLSNNSANHRFVHTIVGGDFNFVMSDCDRISKGDGKPSKRNITDEAATMVA